MHRFFAALALGGVATCVVAAPGIAAEPRQLPRGFAARVEMAEDGSTRDLLRDLRVDVGAAQAHFDFLFAIAENGDSRYFRRRSRRGGQTNYRRGGTGHFAASQVVEGAPAIGGQNGDGFPGVHGTSERCLHLRIRAWVSG